jgi:hypothetical protein
VGKDDERFHESFLLDLMQIGRGDAASRRWVWEVGEALPGRWTGLVDCTSTRGTGAAVRMAHERLPNRGRVQYSGMKDKDQARPSPGSCGLANSSA